MLRSAVWGYRGRCWRDQEGARSCTVPFQNVYWELLFTAMLTSVIPGLCHSSLHPRAAPTCSHLLLTLGRETREGLEPQSHSQERPTQSFSQAHTDEAGCLGTPETLQYCALPPEPPCPERRGTQPQGAPGCERSWAVISDGAAAPSTRPRHKDTQLFVRRTKTTNTEPPLWLQAGGAGPHPCPQEGTQAQPRCATAREELLQVTSPQSRTWTPKRLPEPSGGPGELGHSSPHSPSETQSHHAAPFVST